jgi:hypothetical protein
MTVDPISVAHIAQMDQISAAFRSWAECLHAAQMELMKQGVPQETALDIAREWLTLIIAAVGVRDV